MLAHESDKLLDARLQIWSEASIHDTRVSALDEKVSHVIQMNSELMIQSNENFRDIRSALDDQRAELKQSLKQLRGTYSTRCQLVAFGCGLFSWTMFMAWVMWA